MKVRNIQAREIFDSRGLPTIECQLTLTDGTVHLASVPSGASRGVHEAVELRDKERLMGLGVSRAINVIENTIAPLIINQSPNLLEMDQLMIEIDGTDNKSNLGGNSMLAVSMAVARAQAFSEGFELYEFLAYLIGSETVSLPFPLFNMINGGRHASNPLIFQEFMVLPILGQSFRQAMEVAVVINQKLKELLLREGYNTAVGDEGGFAPLIEHDYKALDLLVESINTVTTTEDFEIALDIAASQFYDKETGLYHFHDKKLTSEEMINFYQDLIEAYPIFSLEDPLAEDDWQGWQAITSLLGDKVQLVGDDIFVSSTSRINRGFDEEVANAVLIKPNQIGTVSEALYAVDFARESNYTVIVSHRSGETEDTFIADFGIGVSASQIKAGGCSRSERVGKYNRLLRIEDNLIFGLLDSD